MIVDSDLNELIKPGHVVLVKIDEVGSQLTQLKKDLKSFDNAHLILENGRNIRLIYQLLRNGKTPVLLMGKASMDGARQEVKDTITHILKPSQYMSEEAAEMFLF